MRSVRLLRRTTWLVCLLCALGAGACGCRRSQPGDAPDAAAPAIPAAVPAAEAVERVLAESRARQAALATAPDLELLARRFYRMNLVALGRDPEDGSLLYTAKNESPGFRQFARVLRAQLGDGPVDALGEQLADRAVEALVDGTGTFRVPLRPETFREPRLSEPALALLGWTRDLPLLLVHYGLVDPDNRSRLPRFTLRTLLRARWNLETNQAAEHALTDVERIAWLDFRARYRRQGPMSQRRQALEELSRLLPSYPLEQALEALLRESVPAGGRIVEEGARLP